MRGASLAASGEVRVMGETGDTVIVGPGAADGAGGATPGISAGGVSPCANAAWPNAEASRTAMPASRKGAMGALNATSPGTVKHGSCGKCMGSARRHRRWRNMKRYKDL